MCNCVSLSGRRIAFALPLIIALALCLGSCHSRKSAVVAKPGYSQSLKPSQIASSSYSRLPDATKRLMAEADKWLGTPYRYGGTARGKGADCSGFVTQVFSDALAIKLPRNSARQQQWCSVLRGGRSEMVPGDLVFFSSGKRGGVNHVGLYLGDGKMIHSSSSKGVIVSSLDEAYYTRTYHSTGRVEPYYAMVKRKGVPSEPADRPLELLAATPEPEPQPSASQLPAPRPKPTATATISLDKLAETTAAAAHDSSATQVAQPILPARQQPDTALSANEARSRLLKRLESDSIR